MKFGSFIALINLSDFIQATHMSIVDIVLFQTLVFHILWKQLVNIFSYHTEEPSKWLGWYMVI
jgi:hypothetical protein